MTNDTVLAPLSDKAWLLARNPSAVFLCWTWSRVRAEAFETSVYEPGIVVRLFSDEDKDLATETETAWNSGKIYLKPPAEGKSYSAAIYSRKKDGTREKLLETNSALVPVSSPMPGVSSGYSSSEFFRKAAV